MINLRLHVPVTKLHKLEQVSKLHCVSGSLFKMGITIVIILHTSI